AEDSQESILVTSPFGGSRPSRSQSERGGRVGADERVAGPPPRRVRERPPPVGEVAWRRWLWAIRAGSGPENREDRHEGRAIRPWTEFRRGHPLARGPLLVLRLLQAPGVERLPLRRRTRRADDRRPAVGPRLAARRAAPPRGDGEPARAAPGKRRHGRAPCRPEGPREIPHQRHAGG